jgi:hypothetical protein
MKLLLHETEQTYGDEIYLTLADSLFSPKQKKKKKKGKKRNARENSGFVQNRSIES